VRSLSNKETDKANADEFGYRDQLILFMVPEHPSPKIREIKGEGHAWSLLASSLIIDLGPEVT
jgi:hypothetical protein